jgi:hypothetical protein
MLRQLVDKTSSSSPGRGRETVHGQEREWDEEDNFGVGMADDDNDNARSIRTIVPHELEIVDEVDEEQLAKQEWEDNPSRTMKMRRAEG